MKFEIGDETDNHLTITMAHEYSRAKEAYQLFVTNREKRIKAPYTKELKVKEFNYYTYLICHLYEFYIGCSKRSRKSTAPIGHRDTDLFLNKEAEKLIRIVSERRVSLKKPIEVPVTFGEHFRWIRNRNNHVDYKRSSAKEISLSSFYSKYNEIIMILYHYPNWVWDIKDWYEINMNDIESFCSLTATNRKYFKNIF
jgi:hypothetical protein